MIGVWITGVSMIGFSMIGLINDDSGDRSRIGSETVDWDEGGIGKTLWDKIEPEFNGVIT